MRISDWSSDVCSSDLFRLFMIAILLCLAIIIILAGLRARKISPLSMLAKLFSHFAKAPPPLAHAPEGRRIYAIGDIHGHLDLLDGLLAQIFADERTGGVSGELIFLRSEEHTSELQSLMRISYAVFCLKKNKNKKHDTYIQI